MTPAELYLLRSHEPTLRTLLDSADAEVEEAREDLKKAPQRLKEALKDAKKRRHYLASLHGECSQETLDRFVANVWVDPERILRKRTDQLRRDIRQASLEVKEHRHHLETASRVAEEAQKTLGEKHPERLQAEGELEEVRVDHEALTAKVATLEDRRTETQRQLAQAVEDWWTKQGAPSPEEEKLAWEALNRRGFGKRLEASEALAQ